MAAGRAEIVGEDVTVELVTELSTQDTATSTSNEAT